MATCPRINMGCGRKVIPSLLDSGSQVTLIHQSFFEQEILPHIEPTNGEKAKAHQLFQLTAANNGKLRFHVCRIGFRFSGYCCAISRGSNHGRAQ